MISYLLGTEHLIRVLLYIYSIFKAPAFLQWIHARIFSPQNRGNTYAKYPFLKQIKSQNFQCNLNLIIILNI